MNPGGWLGLAAVMFAAAAVGAGSASSQAAAQTRFDNEGLPIYDDQMGRPKSRLVDITAPASVASLTEEAPAAPEPTVARPPVKPEPAPAAEMAAATVEEPAAAAPEAVSEPVMDAAEAAEAAAPQPETEPEPTATAAVEPPEEAPAASAALAQGPVMVLFPAGGAELPSEGEAQLDSVVAALAADASVRLQLKAYADGSDGAASAARRLSLSRALAVRGYLIDSGVSSTRIDVRALGAKFENGPADRVDVIPIK